MGAIEPSAVEHQVVERVSILLDRCRESEFSTTETLSHVTTILAWTMQRLQGELTLPLRELRDRWAEVRADQWPFPEGLKHRTVFQALKKLRDATAHAGSDSSIPKNYNGDLVGFTLGNSDPGYELWNAEFHEDQLREIGLRVAREFVQASIRQ